MASIQAQQDYLTILKRDAQAAWIKACEADGIELSAKFVVLSNTASAAAYNELMGLYLKAVRNFSKQLARNKARRARHAAHTSLGLKRVKGALGGTYYE